MGRLGHAPCAGEGCMAERVRGAFRVKDSRGAGRREGAVSRCDSGLRSQPMAGMRPTLTSQRASAPRLSER